MTKKLIIAEKPSVASDIAKALGGFTNNGDFFENDEYVISSAVGHLLTIHADSFDIKRGKWNLNNLPVIPPHFELQPIAKTEPRLKVLLKLIKRKDVSSIINACDAGREGELIFKLIIQYANCKKPLQRLWLQSMTPQAIKNGFANLKDDAEMHGLADAARCRSEADWLVGINGTRAMTAFNNRDGGFFLTTVGRVQTPTLSIVVEREEKRKNFISQKYWEIHAKFLSNNQEYEGKWFDENSKQNNPDNEYARDNRIFNQEQADTILEECKKNNKPTATEETKPSQQNAPALFDLTTLQREVNAKFGLSAKNTLAVAQALYEKHKLITYPRTDSRYLPQDYIQTSQDILHTLSEQNNYTKFIKKALTGVKPNKRIFDDSKVSDHFAIIPTIQTPKKLSEIEQKIYDLIVKRFIAIFFPAAEYLITTRITKLGKNNFKTEGKILDKAGWLEVYNKTEQDDTLCPLHKDDLYTKELNLIEDNTKAPARYNEATLLSAMEGAGKFIEDEELKQALKTKGLGTPATRATIIEGLINENYIFREGKDLIPTAKAFQLLTLLRGIGAHELSKPELTGEWEYKLAQIEKNQQSRLNFMQEIADMTTNIVNKAKEYTAETIPGSYITLKNSCPDCGADIKENYRRFSCEKCDFSFSKTPAGRQFELEEVQELLQNKTIGPLQGFRSKQGRPFASILQLIKIENQTKLQFDFGQQEIENIDLSEHEIVGICPKCSANVYETNMKYICEKTIGENKSCNFSSSKVILQQELYKEEFIKLLRDKKTNLLTNFKSARTGRNFKAYLIIKDDGAISFEFETQNKTVATKTNESKSRKKTSTSTTDNIKTKSKSKTTPKPKKLNKNAAAKNNAQ